MLVGEVTIMKAKVLRDNARNRQGLQFWDGESLEHEEEKAVYRMKVNYSWKGTSEKFFVSDIDDWRKNPLEDRTLKLNQKINEEERGEMITITIVNQVKSFFEVEAIEVQWSF